MKAFIEISKMVRARYNKELPCIAAMCKMPQREDVKFHIEKYLKLKSQSVNKMRHLSIIIITILFFSCQATRMYDSEGFYIEQQNVYHYSVYGDTTLINYRDTEILRNDSLIQFYFE